MTACGDILTGGQVFNVDTTNVDVSCENNICFFSCKNEDEVPNHRAAACGLHPINQTDDNYDYSFDYNFDYSFDLTQDVTCAPKGDDTACGNVREFFMMSDDTDFTIEEFETGFEIIMFECGGSKLARPSTSVCNKDTKQFEHVKGVPMSRKRFFGVTVYL